MFGQPCRNDARLRCAPLRKCVEVAGFNWVTYAYLHMQSQLILCQCMARARGDLMHPTYRSEKERVRAEEMVSRDDCANENTPANV